MEYLLDDDDDDLIYSSDNQIQDGSSKVILSNTESLPYDLNNPVFIGQEVDLIQSYFGQDAAVMLNIPPEIVPESMHVGQNSENSDANLEEIIALFKLYYRKQATRKLEKDLTYCTVVFKISKDGGREALKSTFAHAFKDYTRPHFLARTGSLTINNKDPNSNEVFDITFIGHDLPGITKGDLQALADSKINACGGNIVGEWHVVEGVPDK